MFRLGLVRRFHTYYYLLKIESRKKEYGLQHRVLCKEGNCQKDITIEDSRSTTALHFDTLKTHLYGSDSITYTVVIEDLE